MKFIIHSLPQFWILDPFDYASAFALSNVEWASAGQARSLTSENDGCGGGD